MKYIFSLCLKGEPKKKLSTSLYIYTEAQQFLVVSKIQISHVLLTFLFIGLNFRKNFIYVLWWSQPHWTRAQVWWNLLFFQCFSLILHFLQPEIPSKLNKNAHIWWKISKSSGMVESPFLQVLFGSLILFFPLKSQPTWTKMPIFGEKSALFSAWNPDLYKYFFLHSDP